MMNIKGVLLAVAFVVGCGQGNAADSKAAAGGNGEDPNEAAKSIYGMRCAACHGATGAGDGAAAAQLNPKPRDFRDKAWQASVTDQHIEKIILEGGPAVGKNAAMPPNPDLAQKPQVVAALRALVRGLAH